MEGGKISAVTSDRTGMRCVYSAGHLKAPALKTSRLRSRRLLQVRAVSWLLRTRLAAVVMVELDEEVGAVLRRAGMGGQAEEEGAQHRC